MYENTMTFKTQYITEMNDLIEFYEQFVEIFIVYFVKITYYLNGSFFYLIIYTQKFHLPEKGFEYMFCDTKFLFIFVSRLALFNPLPFLYKSSTNIENSSTQKENMVPP